MPPPRRGSPGSDGRGGGGVGGGRGRGGGGGGGGASPSSRRLAMRLAARSSPSFAPPRPPPPRRRPLFPLPLLLGLPVLLLSASTAWFHVARLGGEGGGGVGSRDPDERWRGGADDPRAEFAGGERRRNETASAQVARRSSEASRRSDRRRDRVYCMVPFIWTPSAYPNYDAIRATWGKRCSVLRFFVDPIVGDDEVGHHNLTRREGASAAAKANVTMPEDAVVLHGMRRPWHTCGSEENEARNKPEGTCRNIFEKVWRMISHVARYESDAAEWFVKVDADSYLFPSNVGRYVRGRNWTHDEHRYFGHVLHHRKDDRDASIVAGGAVFFSRATLVAAGKIFDAMPLEGGDEEEDGTCRDAYTGTEEVATAVCLKRRPSPGATPGSASDAPPILAEAALDSAGRDLVSLYEVDDILTYNRTDQGEWWFWEGKEKAPCHDAGDCLADLPLAFHHYKEPELMLDLEEEFYGKVARAAAKGEEEGDNDGATLY
ncbi:hypothetical protein ACHAWF_017991 [Thalassiosira exigua]